MFDIFLKATHYLAKMGHGFLEESEVENIKTPLSPTNHCIPNRKWMHAAVSS